MKKRMALMLLSVGIVFAGLLGFNMFKAKMIKAKLAEMANPVQTVSSTKIGFDEWQPKIEAVGSLRAVKGADLATETAGIVESVHFISDSEVKEGDVLVRLRTADDDAKLQSLIAVEKLAEITLERDKKQLDIQAVSQSTVDSDQATYDGAKAAREQQQATIEKKTIRAPFAGHAGVRLYNVGQYVNAGATIVTLQQMDPIYVDFHVPEQSLRDIKVGQKLSLKSDTFPDKKFMGEVTAVDPKIDTDTRNILVQATFKNPDRLMVPGMFASLSVQSGKPRKYLTLPQTAITYNSYGNTVYVVEEKKADPNVKTAAQGPQLAVRQTFIKLGEKRGDQVAVLDGLKEGDVIVTSGQQKLRNGSLVKINNEIQPPSDADPKPHED